MIQPVTFSKSACLASHAPLARPFVRPHRLRRLREFIAQAFSTLDANQDGVLTADELNPQLRDGLMRADADGDGRVTQDEMRAARKRAGLPAD